MIGQESKIERQKLELVNKKITKTRRINDKKPLF